MGKTFITERDIEDMHRDGLTTLHVNNDVVLTDLAREKAGRLDIQLIKGSQTSVGTASCASCTSSPNASSSDQSYQALKAQVRQAVIARIDPQVDIVILDNIIDRVAHRLGII